MKGAFGGPSAVKIDLVHPTVAGAADFQHQPLPLDMSQDWMLFFKHALQKKLGDALIRHMISCRKYVTQDVDQQEVTRNDCDKLKKDANGLYKQPEEQSVKVRVGSEER